MPRGFLVKRHSSPLSTLSTITGSQTSQTFQHSNAVPLPLLTTRPAISRYSDEDRSESSSSENETTSSTTGQSQIHLNSPTVASPLLPYIKQFSSLELPQEVPLALTKSPSSMPKVSASPSKRESSPAALDLRCPNFVFHFPNNLPSSAPASFDRRLSVPGSTASFSTTKKRQSAELHHKPLKRHKVIRKLNFDEHKSSPVSGTFIRDSDSEEDFASASSCVRRSGDIDPSFNVVVVTEEARAELAKIENKIGDYICALCKERFQDAFGLAQHRCNRIVHVEYRCPECDKVFNCPANLASHRRWHKPRNNCNESDGKANKIIVTATAVIQEQDSLSDTKTPTPPADATSNSQEATDGLFECEQCGKKFRRQAYLKKHLLSHNNAGCERTKHSNHYINSIEKHDQNVLDFSLSNKMIIRGESDIEDDLARCCPFCQVEIPNRLAMELHARTLHSNDIYFCKFCPSIFYSANGLAIHINKFHSIENSKKIVLSANAVTS